MINLLLYLKWQSINGAVVVSTGGHDLQQPLQGYLYRVRGVSHEPPGPCHSPCNSLLKLMIIKGSGACLFLLSCYGDHDAQICLVSISKKSQVNMQLSFGKSNILHI